MFPCFGLVYKDQKLTMQLYYDGNYVLTTITYCLYEFIPRVLCGAVLSCDVSCSLLTAILLIPPCYAARCRENALCLSCISYYRIGESYVSYIYASTKDPNFFDTRFKIDYLYN